MVITVLQKCLIVFQIARLIVSGRSLRSSILLDGMTVKFIPSHNLTIITTNDSISAAIAVRTFKDASLRMPLFFVVTSFINLGGGFWFFICVFAVPVIPGHNLSFGIARYSMAPALSIRCMANLAAWFIPCTVLKTPKWRRYCGGWRCRRGCGDGGWCWCRDGAGGNRTCSSCFAIPVIPCYQISIMWTISAVTPPISIWSSANLTPCWVPFAIRANAANFCGYFRIRLRWLGILWNLGHRHPIDKPRNKDDNCQW